MKRNSLTIGLGIGIASALLLAGCSASDTGQQDGNGGGLEDMEPMVLRVATLSNQDNYNTTPQTAFTDRIEERTGGKVSFEYFYAGSLVPSAELPGALGQGVYDFGYFIPTYDAAAFPLDTWASQLASEHTSDALVGELQAAAAGLEWSSELEAYSAQFLDANIVPILPQVHITNAYSLLCKTDNSTLESVEGKRVRVGGETWAAEAENLGMVPVTIPYTEVYQAFQQGLIDCFMGSPRDVYAIGLTDHAKYLNSTGFTGWSSASVGFNRDIWESFPSEVKEIIREEAPQLMTDLIEAGMEVDMEFAEEGTASGVQFVVPDAAMLKKIDSFQQKLREEAVANAPVEVTDSEAAARAHTEIHEEWKSIIVNELGFSDGYRSWADFAAAGETLPDLADFKAQMKTRIFDNYLVD